MAAVGVRRAARWQEEGGRPPATRRPPGKKQRALPLRRASRWWWAAALGCSLHLGATNDAMKRSDAEADDRQSKRQKNDEAEDEEDDEDDEEDDEDDEDDEEEDLANIRPRSESRRRFDPTAGFILRRSSLCSSSGSSRSTASSTLL